MLFCSQYYSVTIPQCPFPMWIFSLLLAAIVFVPGCRNGEPAQNDNRPFVVTTTNLIHDVVRNVGGDDIRTVSLMGPGVDPHVYRATPRDFHKMERSDLVLYNGLYLEGRLSEILDRLGDQSRAVTGTIPREKLIDATDFGGAYDPHVWFDAKLWTYVVKDVRDALTKLLPEHEEDFARRAYEYVKELRALHAYAEKRIQDLPQERRIMITAHDAFRYFSRAYDIEVRGLQGLSTATEFGIQDVTRMVSLIIERGIPAIFIETGVNTRAIESVVAGVRRRGYEIQIGGKLFSDSMGAMDTPEGTYSGMFRHNVDTIVTALSGELHPS